jgi:serine/threonine protein kinase
MIKKEIPGPDTVDEFLYEVNALDSLLGCDNVVQLEGLVTDDRGELVKGLLISYASQGPLVDMIYDFRGTSQLPWYRREKWAKQIVGGLSDIHEAGFVQGDFTLSNIVIDEDDNAIIIDINRRGCPVGWEPPELSRLIDSGQRIGMCIGVKTDLFQLGMVLWALAEEVDEPERVERPLPSVLDDIPDYYRRIVKTCLRERPQGRVSANELLRLFPDTAGLPPMPRSYVEFDHEVTQSSLSAKKHRSDKEYIDPKMAVTIDDVKDRRRSGSATSQVDSDQVIYVDPYSNPASSYRFGSSGSWVVGRRSRGRSLVSSRRRRSSPYGRSVSSATSLSGGSPQRRAGHAGSSAEAEKGRRTDQVGNEEENACAALADEVAASSHNLGFAHTHSGFDELIEGPPLVDDKAPAHFCNHSDTASPNSYYTPAEMDVRPRTLSLAGAQLGEEELHDTKLMSNDRDDCSIPNQYQHLEGAGTA